MAPTAAMLMLGYQHHTGGGSTSPPPPPLPPAADSPAAAFRMKASAMKWVLNYIPISQQTTPPQPKQYKRDQSPSSSDSAWEMRFQEVLDLIYW